MKDGNGSTSEIQARKPTRSSGSTSSSPTQSDWLKVPERRRGGPATNGTSKPSKPKAIAIRDKRRMAARLKRAESNLADRDRRIVALEGRVRELEAELEGLRDPKTRTKPQTKSRKGGSASLNEVTFEELRSFGLSVTQCARLIAIRDSNGGFDSLDDLDGITRFSKETIRDLKQSLAKPRPTRKKKS